MRMSICLSLFNLFVLSRSRKIQYVSRRNAKTCTIKGDVKHHLSPILRAQCSLYMRSCLARNTYECFSREFFLCVLSVARKNDRCSCVHPRRNIIFVRAVRFRGNNGTEKDYLFYFACGHCKMWREAIPPQRCSVFILQIALALRVKYPDNSKSRGLSNCRRYF